MSGGRGIPFHCPYCGEETLRPTDQDSAGHGGSWECHSCLRAFSLKMLGMVERPTTTPVPTLSSTGSPTPTGSNEAGR